MSRFIACVPVFCLVVSGLPAFAAPVTLLSRADPDRPSDTPGAPSEIAAVSADARYVVSASLADNALPGVADTNRSRDLFFHDRLAGTTVLISHAAGDPLTAGNRGASSAAMSADGRWVAFMSESTDLVAGQVDTEGDPGSSFAPDVFLWDRDTGITILVSHQAGLPTTAAGSCWNELAMSGDGGRIAFSSFATNLMAGQSDGGSTSDLFLYNRADGTNTLVSHTSGSATAAAGGSFGSVISADGSWVAFESDSPGLVAGQVDTNGNVDVFLHEVATGTNVLVSHAAGAAATAGNDEALTPRISADGSRIVYESRATNLAAGVTDSNESFDVFLYDRASGSSTLVSHTSSSATTAGDDSSAAPVLSADGRHVAYLSRATDLVPGVFPNPFFEVFVYDRITGANLLVSRDPTTPSDNQPFLPQISADGAWIAFLSFATNLIPGQVDVPFTRDVFLWSRASGSLTLVTRTPGSATTVAGGETTGLRIGPDGSRITLASNSSDLVAGVADYNMVEDLFVYERSTATHSLVTSRSGAASASASGYVVESMGTVMSDDGRYVAFTSMASNFSGVTSDENRATDIFFADRVTGAVTLVSHASGSSSTAGDAQSYGAVVSGDGTVVLFGSDASNLLSPPVSGAQAELYLFDRTTGEVTLVSHAAGFPAAPASGGLHAINHYAVSGDGRWTAFAHTGTDLVAGQVDGNSGSDIFLFDRVTGESTLVSHASSSPVQTGSLPSSAPSISADGRYVAFKSRASDLVPGAFGQHVYLYDQVTGTNTRVGPVDDFPLSLSTDGRWLLFSSSATDLVPGQVDANLVSDVFLWDRVSGSTILVSHIPASPTTTGNVGSLLSDMSDAGSAPTLSADGRWAVFISGATDLVSGQTGEPGNVFLFDRLSGAVTLVSRSAASPTVARRASHPAISADGRFVTFASSKQDLVPGQATEGDNHFLYDRVAGTTALVSHLPSSEVTDGALEMLGLGLARLSADGAWVEFTSSQPDLVAGDHNWISDVFLHGRPFARDFFLLTPCRILDTRLAGQGPALTSGLKRTMTAHGSCSIPETARALAVNVTVVQPTAAGFLTFHAGDMAPETASTLNFGPGQLRSNNAILPLSFDGRGLLAVTPLVGGGGTVHLIVDVSGWFE